jgi:hypothetical protein
MTTTVNLVPNATQPGALNCFIVGPSAHEALADADDSSYVELGTGSSSNGFVSVEMATFALPAGAVVTAVRNNHRSSSVGASTFISVFRARSATVTYTGVTTAISNYSNTYTDDGGVFVSTQAEIDAYRLNISSYDATDVRVYRATIDVDYLSAPTTTVSNPTGTITTTNITTATWAHVSVDALVQAAYQLKVFTAAQYGAGGFDPATSPSTYDTGIVASSTNTLVLPALPTATTYRAYVRTAQLANGAYQWALAYGSSTFTINVVGPVVSSVVATAVSASGRVDLLATRTASPVWDLIEWQASYDGATTWVPLRGYTSVSSGAGTTATAVDYEAPNGVAAVYRARGTDMVAGLPVTGAWTLSNVVTWTDTSPCSVWLKDVAHPSRNMHIDAQMPDVVRDRIVGVFRPIGATYPVVVSDVLQAGTSTITIVTRSDAEAAALRTVAAGNVLLLQTPATPGWQWGNRYVAPGALQETWTTPGHLSSNRVWSLALTEVARPPDDGVS